jgi:predicted transcriptional regulator
MITGAEIRRRRKALGLGLVELSNHWGISQAQLSLVERGKRKPRAWMGQYLALLEERQQRASADALRQIIDRPTLPDEQVSEDPADHHADEHNE